ncbi:MAG: CPBP family intramembrane metalloprotease [Candidatus Krumholzibacteriota bacterium]|nr:CPBP family intramembrane metalloprotease [Candidatus Krumholzibacteriota bacterium]
MSDEENRFQSNGNLPPSGSIIFDYLNNYFLLFFALACYLVFSSLVGLLYQNGNIVLSITLPSAAGFILPPYLLARKFGCNFFHEYRIRSLDWTSTLSVILLTAGAILPVDMITEYFDRARPVDTDYINFILSIKPKGTLSFLYIFLGIVLVAPAAEELLFRGFIQRIFQRNMKGFPAVFLASFLFGAVHFSLTLIPGIMTLGLILGYLFYRTGNLSYSFISHALFNFVSLLRLHFTGEEAIRGGESSSPSAAWIIVSGLVLGMGLYLLERLRARRI